MIMHIERDYLKVVAEIHVEIVECCQVLFVTIRIQSPNGTEWMLYLHHQVILAFYKSVPVFATCNTVLYEYFTRCLKRNKCTYAFNIREYLFQKMNSCQYNEIITQYKQTQHAIFNGIFTP